MKKKSAKGKFRVLSDCGLHAIPSLEIVKCASNYKSQVYLVYQKQTVSAKSLLSILLLAAVQGARIGVQAVGDDAEEAVRSILHLAERMFNSSLK